MMTTEATVLENQIKDKIQQSFSPDFFEIENESHKHRSGTGVSHFRLVIVSSSFADKRLITRHRAVNTLLAEELGSAVHALALHTFTPQEWLARGEQSSNSPSCNGQG